MGRAKLAENLRFIQSFRMRPEPGPSRWKVHCTFKYRFRSLFFARQSKEETAAEEKKGEQEFKQKKEYFKN
jgi:hypothetical protein